MKMDRFGPLMDPARFNWTPTIRRKKGQSGSLDRTGLFLSTAEVLPLRVESNTRSRYGFYEPTRQTLGREASRHLS
jgi:hypothetical protein